MNVGHNSWMRALLPFVLVLAPAAAAAQATRPATQSARVQACSLITRADVTRATGQDPYVDAEPAAGGSICGVGTAELKLYSGPQSWAAWESTLKSLKKENEPRTPAPAFGNDAYFLFLKAENRNQVNVGFLVVKSGEHTLALSIDADEGEAAESVRPALESLMRTVVSRLR